MLAKIWKKVLLIICIVAIILNMCHKLVSRTSVKEQLIELATTESLSTSIKNFVKERFGDESKEDSKEFSNPVGEIVDVFKKKDDTSANSNDSSDSSEKNQSPESDENVMNPETNSANQNNEENQNNEANSNDTQDAAQNNNTSTESGENGFTKFMQNIKTDIDDNPYFNDDPSDDLIDTTPPHIDF